MTKKRGIVEQGPSDATFFLSTGSTILDLTISGMVDPVGGIPLGRLTEIYGGESSGKSFISGELIGDAQKKNWKQYLIDVERSFEFERSKIFGIDITDENFNYYPNDDFDEVNLIEDLFGKYADGNKIKYGLVNAIAKESTSEDKAIIIIDSIAVLSTKMEDAGKDKHGASRAKMFSTGLRQTIGDISNKNIAVVFDNQLRDNMGAMPYAPKTASPGGWAIKHYCSIRIKLAVIGKIKHKKTGIITGVKIKCTTVKNKIDTQFRECIITLDFNYGIDDIRDCIEYLKSCHDIIQIKKGIYKLPNYRKSIKGIDNFIKHIEDNDLEEELIDLTRTEWRKKNTFEKRKPKRRIQYVE